MNPQEVTSMRRRSAVIAMLVGGLILAMLASCGAGDADSSAPSEDDTPTAADASTTTATTASSDGADVGSRAGRIPVEVDGLAFADHPAETVAPAPVSPDSSASTAAGSGTPTPSGAGGAPVTTISPGQPADPGSIYRGELGVLGADEVVASAVVSAPTVAPGTQPLTGLAGDAPNRPALVVKIDNSSRARPQSGLDVADIVVEEEVEGGVTRFAAIFHSTNAVVGPVRSGRTTDIGVLVSLGKPLLLYSGANDVTDALLLARSNVQNRSAARSSGYWRNSSRRAPSNLYTDTSAHWASASGGAPPALFAYRPTGVGSPIGEPVSGLTVAYRANRASWEWDGTSWLRSQGGRAHTATSGARIAAANVVVIETRKVDTGMVDSSGAVVPEFVFVGSGRVTVFTDGKKIVGTWTRPTLASVATLTTADGSVIELTPGRTWIEVIQADAGLLQ
jgi:hypothetical protein